MQYSLPPFIIHKCMTADKRFLLVFRSEVYCFIFLFHTLYGRVYVEPRILFFFLFLRAEEIIKWWNEYWPADARSQTSMPIPPATLKNI